MSTELVMPSDHLVLSRPLTPGNVWERHCICVVTEHRLGSLELEQSNLLSSPAPCLGHTEASLLIILLFWT